jgi:hypothetical protein
MAQLTGNTNVTALREVVRLAETQALLDRVREHFSRALAGQAKSQWPGLSGDPTERLRPLWQDVGDAETHWSMHGQDRRINEWILALRLSPNRAGLWNTNLWQVFASSSAMKPTASKQTAYPGWEVRTTNASGVFRFATASNWCVVAWARDNPVSADKFLAQLKVRSASPATTNWLTAWWDWGKLPASCCPAWLGDSQPGKTPIGTFHLNGSGGYLRSHLKVQYPQAQSWNLQPWNVPTNIILDPMVSFTAIQGFGPWLAKNTNARLLEFNPVPNQLYLWALAETPFQTYAAMQVKNGSNTLTHLATRLPDFIKACFPPRGVGAIVMQTNNMVVSWRGLPFIVPYALVEKGPGGDFLVGGLFPTAMTNTTPMDIQLAAQIQGRTDVFLYDWEITQDRLLQLRTLVPLLGMLANDTGDMSADTAAQAHQRLIADWIRAVAPHLGNTVTEVVASSPKEITATRKSHIGLNSAEIMALTRWLSSPEFIPGGTPPAKPAR